MKLDRLLKPLGASAPVRAEALWMYLAGQGELLDPSERRGLHPLLLPMCRDAQGRVTGLLHWPTAEANSPAPVVRTGELGLDLIATSTDALLHRELALRDASPTESMGGLLAAANRPGLLYEEGAVHTSPLPLKAYILLHVGGSPAFFDELVAAHLERGDTQAALVTAERASASFEGWARPHAMVAMLYASLDRPEEARDCARGAMQLPVWTLGRPFAPIAELAGWRPPITSAPYRRLVAKDDRLPGDRAAYLMDAATVEGSGWEAIREQLASLYQLAGMSALASFVRLDQ